MKVLVVDDEKDVQVLFEQRFRKEIKSNQIDLVFAFSGEDALTYLKGHDHEASVLELLRQIKQEYMKPTPVVMMITAYGDAYNFSIAKELGADDFLTKPVDFTLLKEKLKL